MGVVIVVVDVLEVVEDGVEADVVVVKVVVVVEEVVEVVVGL